MSEQEKFDDLVRSKFSEEGDFPFDEENWAKAEEMIVATRQKEKRKRWGIIFFAGLLIGVLVMIPLIINKGDDTQLAIKKEKDQITSDKSNDIVNSTNTTEIKEAEKTPVNTSNEISNTQNTENEKEKKITSVTPTGAKEEKTGTTAGSQVTTTAVGKEKEKTAPVVKKNTTQVVTPSVKTTEQTNEVKKKDVSVVKNEAVKKQEENKTKEPVVIVEKKNKETKDKTPATGKTNEPGNSKANVTEEKNKENKVANESKDNKKDAVVPVETNTVVAIDPSKNENTQQNSTTLPVAKDSAKKEQPAVTKKDSTPPVVANPPADSLPKTNHSWTFSADLGMNGFISGGNSVSPILGVNLTKALGTKWEIGTGAYYTYIPTFASTNTFTTSIDYDFGSTLKLTQIVTNKLHYVTAPLFVKYNFNAKNSVIVGANFYYLFNSSNVVTSYDLSYTGIKNVTTAKTTGYYNSFSPYDVGIIAGYRRDLADRIGVALYFNYGLMSIQRSGASSQSNGHNISGQLMLTYKIFK